MVQAQETNVFIEHCDFQYSASWQFVNNMPFSFISSSNNTITLSNSDLQSTPIVVKNQDIFLHISGNNFSGYRNSLDLEDGNAIVESNTFSFIDNDYIIKLAGNSSVVFRNNSISNNTCTSLLYIATPSVVITGNSV